MADEVKTPVTEAPEGEAPENEGLPEGDAPFKSTDEATVEPESDTTEAKVSDDAEAAAEAIKPGDGKEAPVEDSSAEIDRIIKEAESEGTDTPNVQKRIDKLTAEKKALEERLQKLESQQEAKEGKLPKYTDDQLKTALKKALEEGDSNLAWDIMDHMRKQTKQELIDMYNEEKTAFSKQQERINVEWKETVDAYAKYADTKVPEIWPGSHKDLDLRNGTGMLYQIAMALYWSKDPVKAEYYQKSPGGQKLAVADALTYLLRTKAGKRTDTKVKKLEKQLTKERMKKSPVSGGPSGEEKTPRKPLSEADALSDYIEERKKYQTERET
jgi:hypothetical protein